MVILLVLFSFGVYAAATWIKIWGYCDGPLCPAKRNTATNPVFFKQCDNADSCSRTYSFSAFCSYEGNYYFDGQSNTPNGDANAAAYGPAFNIEWDTDQADCGCYGKDWLVKVSGTGSGNCCGDDLGESYCGAGFTSCLDEVKYDNGDSNQYTCECGAKTWLTSGICGKGAGACNDDPNVPAGDFCCGDDANELMREGIDDVCFVGVNDCYSFSEQKYYSEGESLGDMFCENGKMVSKTRIIALQLLSLSEQNSPNDYILFCDSYQNTLNYYQYDVNTFSVENNYLSEANNICVLRLPNQVIFGVSLKQPIGNSIFIDVLPDIDDCNNGVACSDCDDGQFHVCDFGNYQAYYNNATQGAIYSNSDIVGMPSVNFWDSFLLFLRNPFQSIFNFLMGVFQQEGTINDYRFINSTDKFSRIYLSRKNTKSITGITEDVMGKEYLAINYSGYNENICLTVNNLYDKFRRQGQKGMKDLILCQPNPVLKTYYVATNNSIGLVLWPELTSRLRP